jgi:hypothetical protein
MNHERSGSAMARIIPTNADQVLSKKRIYFGHQSVGYNIVEGMQEWVKERPSLGLKIVESGSPEALDAPAFAHGRIGANYEPLGKIEAFAQTLEQGVGAKADVALFKFCYVDFTPDTDVDRIFSRYKTTLARLHQSFPKTRFVHVTVPLTIVQTGPKAAVKRLLGRKLWGADANIVRNRFNDLMRREYGGHEPLFDLASVESTRPDGQEVRFDQGGASHPALADEYASDGKHLNPDGSRWAAAHLLKTLAELPD